MAEENKPRKGKDVIVTTGELQEKLKEITAKTGWSNEKVLHESIEILRHKEDQELLQGILKDFHNTPPEERKMFNTRIAGILALGLWSMLGLTVLWNLIFCFCCLCPSVGAATCHICGDEWAS